MTMRPIHAAMIKVREWKIANPRPKCPDTIYDFDISEFFKLSPSIMAEARNEKKMKALIKWHDEQTPYRDWLADIVKVFDSSIHNIDDFMANTNTAKHYRAFSPDGCERCGFSIDSRYSGWTRAGRLCNRCAEQFIIHCQYRHKIYSEGQKNFYYTIKTSDCLSSNESFINSKWWT